MSACDVFGWHSFGIESMYNHASALLSVISRCRGLGHLTTDVEWWFISCSEGCFSLPVSKTCSVQGARTLLSFPGPFQSFFRTLVMPSTYLLYIMFTVLKAFSIEPYLPSTQGLWDFLCFASWSSRRTYKTWFCITNRMDISRDSASILLVVSASGFYLGWVPRFHPGG